jgi:hypothetical protein
VQFQLIELHGVLVIKLMEFRWRIACDSSNNLSNSVMKFLIEKCYIHLISQLIHPRYLVISILLNNLDSEVQVDYTVFVDYYRDTEASSYYD